jgi:hypothetical protein
MQSSQRHSVAANAGTGAATIATTRKPTSGTSGPACLGDVHVDAVGLIVRCA